MGLEIERRFRVIGDAWRAEGDPLWYKQGYVSVHPQRTVRVRVVGEQAWLTLKAQIDDRRRHEFEYDIPLADANAMLAAMCPMQVEKQRRRIDFGGFVWEVDEFFGANAGLVLAEIELPDADTPFERPAWLGDEVTQDGRYTNAYLADHPWTTWPEDQR